MGFEVLTAMLTLMLMPLSIQTPARKQGGVRPLQGRGIVLMTLALGVLWLVSPISLRAESLIEQLRTSPAVTSSTSLWGVPSAVIVPMAETEAEATTEGSTMAINATIYPVVSVASPLHRQCHYHRR